MIDMHELHFNLRVKLVEVICGKVEPLVYLLILLLLDLMRLSLVLSLQHNWVFLLVHSFLDVLLYLAVLREHNRDWLYIGDYSRPIWVVALYLEVV